MFVWLTVTFLDVILDHLSCHNWAYVLVYILNIFKRITVMSTDIPISKSLCFTLLNYSSQKFITSCPQYSSNKYPVVILMTACYRDFIFSCLLSFLFFFSPLWMTFLLSNFLVFFISHWIFLISGHLIGHLNISLYILPVSEIDTYLFLVSNSDIPGLSDLQ